MGAALKVLVVGSGGREHALVWKLLQSPRVEHVYVAPGTSLEGWRQADRCLTVTHIPDDDLFALARLAQQENFDLTVVGPEAPLAAGIVDTFHDLQLKIFGPSQAAARLESSKAFAKSFMRDYGIPTAEYCAFSDYEEACDFVSSFNKPLVVKADGLAAGKGVVICDTVAEAHSALQKIMLDRDFGSAGDTVVIEERLIGREVSVLAFSDGRNIAVMPPARDHKRVFDDDQGPNTGGMGAYAPVPDVSPQLLDRICRTILQPVVDGMAERGTPYIGILYAGLMLTSAGPKVLEFNCRFGDPETQVILPLLETDLLEIMLACVAGRLDEVSIHWREGACATVVLASPGYPDSYPKGLPISGLDSFSQDSMMVFRAGTRYQNEQLVTAGGRVLAVSALGLDLPDALQKAYSGLERIHFEGMHYRRDIGRIREE
jgi:phosphoribosylamine--glycine ligase